MKLVAANHKRQSAADPIGPDQRLAKRAAAEPAAAEASFRGNGEYWSVGLREHQALLKDRKGLRYIASLLRSPGNEICVLELMNLSERRPETVTGEDRGAGGGIQWRPVGEVLRTFGDAGPLLDRQAKSAYEHRLLELREAREVAEAHDDVLRARRIEEEVEALRRELSRAFGIGGRPRVAGAPIERARVNVTRSIRLAIERVAEFSPELGCHLDRRIKTGWLCCYTPDAIRPINWRF
ncbi:MAG TPA: hypothetical protein VKS22_07645 [Candidatus Binataceae bacterium]|nr:hypothetical protein [Candidatus Binataceae bacterium]